MLLSPTTHIAVAKIIRNRSLYLQSILDNNHKYWSSVFNVLLPRHRYNTKHGPTIEDLCPASTVEKSWKMRGKRCVKYDRNITLLCHFVVMFDVCLNLQGIRLPFWRGMIYRWSSINYVEKRKEITMISMRTWLSCYVIDRLAYSPLKELKRCLFLMQLISSTVATFMRLVRFYQPHQPQSRLMTLKTLF